MDSWVGYMSIAAAIFLVGHTCYELGQEAGHKKAIASLKCNTVSGYSVINLKTGKCAVIRGKRNG